MKLSTVAGLAALLVATAAPLPGARAELVRPDQHPAGDLFARHAPFSADDAASASPLLSRAEERALGEALSGGSHSHSHEARGHQQHHRAIVKRRSAASSSSSSSSSQHERRGKLSTSCQLGTDHIKRSLSKRQDQSRSAGARMPYPPPGAVPGRDSIPQAWINRYNAKKAAGLIPDLPPSKSDADGNVVYPAGSDMSKICSWTLDKCDTGDIWHAPAGMAAVGFDDGPTPEGTVPLIDVLEKEEITATHFLIGSAIFWNQDVMAKLNATVPRQHLGTHSWSHTTMTNHTDMELIADIGWSVQIIYDFTGMVPMYFRPPLGDTDARVRAICREVFGLQTVLWGEGKDANDWCLREGGGTATFVDSCVQLAPNYATVRKNQNEWASDDKGWISLEHETTDQAVKAFKSLVAALKKNAAINFVGNVPALQGLPFAQNQFGQNDSPQKVKSILPTRAFIKIDDDTAAAGSKGAPDVSAWSKITSSDDSAGSKAATNSSSSSSSSSSSASSGSSAVASSSNSTTSSSSNKSAAAPSLSTQSAAARIAPLVLGAAIALALII